MTDALGFRKKFGVVAPSTNRSVQPEFDAMRPRGVTNHFGRIHIPNNPVRNDAEFNQMMDNIRGAMMQAIDRVMTCEPDYLVMGMSSETFWDGLDGSLRLRERMEKHAGVKVAMGSDSCQAALKCYGARRLGVITPVSERELRDAINEVNGPDVDAILQVGTNLAMARLAGIAEFWLDKPVLAINTCIYWWSLRENGIDDKIGGFGSLLLEH